MTSRLDHPLAAAVASLAIALSVVGVRLVVEAGDISRFVRAAPPFADPAAVPPGLAVTDAGYDGMFYYRLALDPFTDERTAHGITLDLPAYRQQRIAYPLLVWAVSLGDAGRVPVALVAVNVAGLGALGLVGAILARRSGRHALWGMLFTAYPGFVMTLTRDLTEIVAATALLGGLALLRRERATGGGLALAAAALARETTILVAASAGIARLVARPRAPAAWAPLALPAIALVAMQAALAQRWLAAAPAQGATALSLPFVGLATALWYDPQRFSAWQLVAWLVVLAFVAALVVVAARSLRSAGAPAHERLAGAVYLTLAALFEANIWANGAVLRALTELAMLSALFALAAPARWRWSLLGAELATGVVVLAAGPSI